MTPIVIILVLSGLVVNGDALALTKEERSENTIAVTGMNKMQMEAVRVIAEMIERRAEKAAAGELVSYNRSGYNDVGGVLESARAFLVDKRKQVRAYGKSQRANETGGEREKCGPSCIAGIIIDGLFALDDGKLADCKIWVMMIWWVQGVITLMVDQRLSFENAIFGLTQMITTIGYGSTHPSTNGMKIWHALHVVVGITLAAAPTDNLFSEMAKGMISSVTQSRTDNSLATRLLASLPLTFAIIASTFGYAFDLIASGKSGTYAQALLDSFYMTIMSLTTVGYGDVNPGTPAGKLLALPIMMFGTHLFSETYDFFEQIEAPKKLDSETTTEGPADEARTCGQSRDFLQQKLHVDGATSVPKVHHPNTAADMLRQA